MSSSKRQSLVISGIGLIMLSGMILYFGLSQPRISESALSNVSYIETSEELALQESTSPSAELQTSEASATSEISGKTSAVSKADATQQTSQSEKLTQNNTKDTTAAVKYPLNLNSCTLEELMTISGIGEARADAIIQYREYLGGYTSVEEIKNIKGIGDSLYEKVSPYLTV